MVEAVVIGGSAGMLEMLHSIIGNLPVDYPIPIIIAMHLHPTDDGDMADYLNSQTSIQVKAATDKEPILSKCVYMAPANYHLLVEFDKTLALTIDEKVNYARPSIDVLFESAAFVYDSGLAGILLTGSSMDGANGIKAIKQHGGMTVVQDPALAKYSFMPQAAINTGCVDLFLSQTTMKDLLVIR